MNGLTKEKKLQLIEQAVKDFDLTAYEVGHATNLNISSLQKLFDGETKNPHNSTLDTLLSYIETRRQGAALPGHKNFNPNISSVAEPQSEYDNKSDKELLVEYMAENIKLYKNKAYLEKLLRDNNIPFNEMF